MKGYLIDSKTDECYVADITTNHVCLDTFGPRDLAGRLRMNDVEI